MHSGRRVRSHVAQSTAALVDDRVPWDNPGTAEIGFAIPERYNASAILFQNLARGYGNRIAVTGPSGQRSYTELCADAARWGRALLSLGLARGDRILLLLDDTPVYPAVFFGAIRAGLVPLLVNLQATPDLLQFYLADSGARVAVVEASLCDRFGAATCVGTRLQDLIVVNGRQSGHPAAGTLNATHWVVGFPPELQAEDTHRDEMAFWMYSSGSTGRPKGIVHLHHDMPYTAHSYARHVLKLSPDDVCFSPPKIFFSYGFGNSITFPYAAGATTVLLPGRPDPASIFSAIRRYRPSVFFGLPTLYIMLINDPQFSHSNWSSIRLAVSAAETLPADVFNGWKAATGIEIVECLGSTEALNVYLSNSPARKKLGAAGMRVPGYELVIRDQNGREVSDGEEGVLWVRGHSNTPLYWNSPEKTAATVGDDGWLCTGDRFLRDADGFYFFRGRIDDLVKISGQWVYPLEVQNCLAEHALVRECAVLPIQAPDQRTTLKAFVVLRDAQVDLEKATPVLRDYVKRKLPPYKCPRIVQFLRELPKTGTGKIDRQALSRSKETADAEVAA
jgi:benzoate-CoA ligase family protein